MKKILMIGMIVITFVLPMTVSKAQTLDDMYKELASLKEKKKESDQKKKLTTDEINQVRTNIANTNNAIEKARQDIEKAQDDIEDSIIKIQEKKLETEELLKFLQLSGGENVYIEYLFAAEDYTDFIYRYAIVSQLSEYNSNLMNELDKLIKDLEEQKITLANKQKELEKKNVELNNQLKSLGNQLALFTEESVSIDDEIKVKQELISQYEKAGCRRDQDINSCVKVPYATSFRYPVANGYVSSEFGWRFNVLYKDDWDYHAGIDFSGWGEGTPILAAANGIVGAIIERSSCGGNQIYLYHNFNGTKYTTSYLHLLTIKVKVNDVVTQGQVIGTSGGASTASYDGCTKGSHLHFAVGTGWYFLDYFGYSTWVNDHMVNPRDLWPNLPAKGVWFTR